MQLGQQFQGAPGAGQATDAAPSNRGGSLQKIWNMTSGMDIDMMSCKTKAHPSGAELLVCSAAAGALGARRAHARGGCRSVGPRPPPLPRPHHRQPRRAAPLGPPAGAVPPAAALVRLLLLLPPLLLCFLAWRQVSGLPCHAPAKPLTRKHLGKQRPALHTARRPLPHAPASAGSAAPAPAGSAKRARPPQRHAQRPPSPDL